MAARTSGATMAHPNQELQPIATFGPEDHRDPGMRVKLQLGLNHQRQSVRRENDPPDRFLILLTDHTESPPAGSLSGSAAVDRRRSWIVLQGPHQSSRACHSHVARNPNHNTADQLHRHDPDGNLGLRV